MGKNPAFLFYPGDWTRDLGDQPHEIGGAWMLILCSLFWDGGRQTKTIQEWAKILRETRKKTEKILNFLREKHIADFEVLDNQNVTIISRRMVRDFEISKLRKEVGRLGGNPNLRGKPKKLDNQTDNQKPTPSVSVSVSSSNLNPPIPPKGGMTFTDDFVSFWKAYPKKTGKKAAWKSWKAAKDKPPLSEILEAIAKQRATDQWQKDGGQFIPNPSTWINQGRWADEIESEPESPIDAWAKRKQAEMEAAKNGTI